MNSHSVVCLIAAGAMALVWPARGQGQHTENRTPGYSTRLAPPAKGKIPVAFVLTDGATVIDFAGPWEVFGKATVYDRGVTRDEQRPFSLYTVSDTKAPIRAQGGMQIVPDYTFDDAPQPRIVVVPAQGGSSPRMLDWIRTMSKQSDVVMSVCTGAFLLAQAGLLNGKKATTHHDFSANLQHAFPDISVQNGMRYVQSDGVIFMSGGLSSGIDLALHVVELYFGRTVAEHTARYLEYEGKGWTGDGEASVNFSVPDKPGLYATVELPDQASYGLEVAEITLKNDALQFSLVTGGIFHGSIDRDKGSASGTFYLSDGTPIPLTLAHVKTTEAGSNGSTAGAENSLLGEWTGTGAIKGDPYRLILHVQYVQ